MRPSLTRVERSEGRSLPMWLPYGLLKIALKSSAVQPSAKSERLVLRPRNDCASIRAVVRSKQGRERLLDQGPGWLDDRREEKRMPVKK